VSAVPAASPSLCPLGVALFRGNGIKKLKKTTDRKEKVSERHTPLKLSLSNPSSQRTYQDCFVLPIAVSRTFGDIRAIHFERENYLIACDYRTK
jgi:hypothetical protein